MTYYVTVENTSALQYIATVVGWPSCVAEGNTRDEAIERVKKQFIERLNEVEIVPIEIESETLDTTTSPDSHPWKRFAGMYVDNSLFDEVLESIQDYRREIDGDEMVV